MRYCLLLFLLLPALCLAQLPNPADSLLRADTSYVLLQKSTYSIVYSHKRNGPLLSMWTLQASDLGPAERYSGGFYPDTTLPVGWYRAHSIDYEGTGFDRGHLAPSGDRTSCDSVNYSTFVMSNIAGQNPHLNRFTWLSLEEHERKLATEGNTLYIYAGVADSLTSIASGLITVPGYCWKIIFVLPKGKSTVDESTGVIAAWFPNDDSVIGKDWTHYRTTVADIQAKTGLTFLSDVSPVVRTLLLSKSD